MPLCVVLLACGETANDSLAPDAARPDVDAAPELPRAVAGTSRTVPTRVPVQLDGTASDGRGRALSYRWMLDGTPVGSAASLSSTSDARPSFTPDLDGVYVVTLVVSTVAGDSALDAVTLHAANLPPEVSLAPFHAYAGETVTLDGAVRDPNGDALLVDWTLTTRPAASAAVLAGASGVAPSFVADVEGNYELAVSASDGRSPTTRTTVSVMAHHAVRRLAGRLIDAEYSDALDAIVYVAAKPHALHVYTPATGADVVVPLPLLATSVSLSPDGLTAAVGHDAYVSIVRLGDGVKLATLPVPTVVLDVVLGGNGFAYAYPWRSIFGEIQAVDLTTGEVTTGPSIYPGMLGRLHPGGMTMYAVTNRLSPTDLVRLDLDGGAVWWRRDSPYHGDFEICGDLWFSEDGARIFTGCGTVFRATDEPATDMTYVGVLDGLQRVSSLDHSRAAHEVIAVPTIAAERVALRIFDDAQLVGLRDVPTPQLRVDGAWLALTSRHAFFSRDGTRAYAVLLAPASAGLDDDGAVAAYEP